MSNLALRSIARQVRDLNVAKRGATSLYVDGTNGSDTFTGESWRQALATIQGAVDVADPWTQIFIKAGTYAENVIIDTDSISLIGQSRDSVNIHPTATADALKVSSDGVVIRRLSLFGPNYTNCASLSGEHLLLDDLLLDGESSSSGIRLTTPNFTTINNIYASNANLSEAISSFDSAAYITISNCKFNLTAPVAEACVIYMSTLSKSRIFNNDIGAMPDARGYGLRLLSSCADVTVFHNNFISNTTQVKNESSTCKVFENFYNDHTNVDNGFGIATEPYAYTGGTDPRPVVCRDGWNSVSILRSLLRKKTATQTGAAATDASGTSWVDLKTIAPTTSDIELYRLKLTTAGTWAGTAKYRIIVGSTKVYPFGDDKDIDTGVLEDLIFPINIQINETCKIQFRSDNTGDGAGETVTLNQLDYATVI